MMLVASLSPRPAVAAAALGAAYAAILTLALAASGASAAFLGLSFVLGGALVALSVIDLQTLRLPDAITLPLIPAGVVLCWRAGIGDPAWHAAGAAIGFASLAGISCLYERVRGHAGLGLGDAKLLAVAGAWLGVEGLASVVACAAGMALLCIAALAACGRAISRQTRLPFGPFLGLAIWLVWLFGPLQ